MQLDELQWAIDSLYHTPLYHQAYGNDTDTVQIADYGGIAGETELTRLLAPRCLQFSYSGAPKMRITNGGYQYLEGSAGGGSLSGLRFGPSVCISTAGQFVWGDTLLSHQEAFFDSTGTLSGGLLFRSNCGEIVAHISEDDTVRIRGWDVEQFPEF
jgi:hypothetical protein